MVFVFWFFDLDVPAKVKMIDRIDGKNDPKENTLTEDLEDFINAITLKMWSERKILMTLALFCVEEISN